MLETPNCNSIAFAPFALLSRKVKRSTTRYHIIHITPIARKGQWSEEAKIALSARKGAEIANVATDTGVVGRSWLNAHIHAWSKAGKATRHEARKDDACNTVIHLSHSEIPLGGTIGIVIQIQKRKI